MSASLCLYIAGPMRHHKWFNYPSFDAAEVFLLDKGLKCINPAQLDRDAGFDAMQLPEDTNWSVLPDHLKLREVFLRDTEAICKRADGIYLLPGWQNSKGAKAELALAEALGLIVMEQR